MTALPDRPEDIPRAFADAWMARDARALAALFTKDAEFVNVVGVWWHDRADIERAHDYALRSFFAETTLKPGVVRVKRLGEAVAVVQCRFTLTGQRLPDGRVAGPRRTILSFVAQRRDAGWQVAAAQNTDIVEGAETLANTGPLRPIDYRK
ncbi:SgcJ/EcaC family oxidoreductase [Lutimaribacter sp. EGI FJ00015]|uniref:SgcJ/EcaC family oxidoreductase n=1 Tax=Lutimaribacter degradans TaxID=2945989 RepID=A0ACC5ZT82_9RHOB|nr:SgcJ/EcaC family oxidoreductase [Lutimaribacter sp. EGI FJ00013]MCM2561385.1 SgcJ/EcaC family oxidoreductase [Lutimaribacter sp. EGI FJ00013]MCO0612905.1 SgcJ/EcaC family oxidoreductase [Lutimaribacter sp. EGI FJ00015]MCO0635563.1 SgcJ/EcaC family oxidoreductase [Lutimaribacter sp. EGI FJ00014]